MSEFFKRIVRILFRILILAPCLLVVLWVGWFILTPAKVYGWAFHKPVEITYKKIWLDLMQTPEWWLD